MRISRDTILSEFTVMLAGYRPKFLQPFGYFQSSMLDMPQKSARSAVWPFVVVIVTQLFFALFSVYTLSAIRADVNAESLWSKGQHEAVFYLTRYISSGDAQYLQRYKRAIDVPLTGREARLDMEATQPDWAAARAAYTKAGNTPADSAGMVWLMRYFRGFSYLESAIKHWKDADISLLKMARLAGSIEATMAAKSTDATIPPEVSARWLKQIEDLDTEMHPHAIAFSVALGDGARFVERALIIVNLVLAFCLAGLTVWRVKRFLKQRQTIERELAWQASHDSMTGIANRRAFEHQLTAGMKAIATGEAPQAVMFIDLDQFKIVNDTCGHAAGDELLRRICPLLQDRLHAGDLLARLGGDEFGILLRHAAMVRATTIAEDVRSAVEDLRFVWAQRTFCVTASIGLVYPDQSLTTPEGIMRAADVACFMAKEKGRNRVHVHSSSDQDLMRHVGQMDWVQRIHEALDKNHFCLYAQEIAPLAASDEHGKHIEILIRLRDETGAIVPPASFLPAAERFGLMTLIDRWVVREAFEKLSARRQNVYAEPIACCAINLSGMTIGDDVFLGFLKEAFVRFAIPPSMICFEITETCAITNLEAAKHFVGELRALGCRFSLDDFGSGMSSFGYLKHLPVDFLKIDGSFVQNMLSHKMDRAMVEMVNHIGHVMGQKVIAEYVEDDDLADVLKTIGVDYGQGFGIARPKPFDLDFKSVGAWSSRVPAKMSA